MLPDMLLDTAVPSEPSRPSVGIHSVLFHTDPSALERSLEAINRAAEHGWMSGSTGAVHVRYGDCSPSPVVGEEQIDEWRDRFASIEDISMVFFGENLGHGGAQNRIARGAVTDFMIVANPDVIPSARALEILVRTFEDPSVGIAEAKQLPLEHPKDYDTTTGATSWCSGAFSMMRPAQFQAVGGFDDSTFFMYCDDVDLSWRIRASGRVAVMQPAAVVFHDKRLSTDAGWTATEAERYYSAEAALLLAYKWSRSDIVDAIGNTFEQSTDRLKIAALAEFRRRSATGRLPDRIDPDHTTAEFVDGTYGVHRFAL